MKKHRQNNRRKSALELRRFDLQSWERMRKFYPQKFTKLGGEVKINSIQSEIKILESRVK